MYPAKFISVVKNKNPFDKHAWEHTDLMYEYKGHTYIVTKYNNGYMGTPISKQHEEEQKKIDDMISHKNDEVQEWKYEGSAQEGFDLFWDYINNEV